MPHECTTCGRTFENGSKEMLSGCPDCGGNKFQFQPGGRRSGTEDAGAKNQSASTTEPSTAVETDEPTADAGDPTASDERPTTAESSSTADATTDLEREIAKLSEDPDETSANASVDDPADVTARSGVDDEYEDAEISGDLAEENAAQNDARTSQATLDEIAEARKEMEEAAEEQRSNDESRSGRGTPQGPPQDPPSSEDSEAFDISGAVGPEDGDPVEKQPVGGSTGETAEPVTDEDSDLSSLRAELNDQFESIKITAPGQYELNLMELYDRKEYIISLQEDGRYVIEMADDYGIDED